MVKKKKRAPGGGRKPNPNKKVIFSIRLEPEIMARLKAAAAQWQNGSGNVSAFTERLINNGLRDLEESKRDPALRALLFLIGKIADRLSLGIDTQDKTERSLWQREWRIDLLRFRAFKIAVRKLLDAIDEPLDNFPPYEAEKAKEMSGPNPELAKWFLEIHKSPEALADYEFKQIWDAAHRTSPLTEEEREAVRKYPHIGRVLLDDFYELPKARAALDLVTAYEGAIRDLEATKDDKTGGQGQ